MMTCEEYRKLSADPVPEAERVSALNGHRAVCARCAQSEALLEASLMSWKETPGPSPSSAALARLQARLASDAHAELLAQRKPVAEKSGWRDWLKPVSLRWALVPTFGLLVLSVSWQELKEQQEPQLTARSARALTEDASRPEARAPSIDLQAVIELADRGQTSEIVPAENGTLLRAGSGLLFHVVAEGGGQVALIERAPGHQLRVLHTWTGLDPAALGPAQLEITDGSGSRLRYVPDGSPGAYTYLAVLNQTEQTLDAAALDRIWGQYVEQKLKPLQTDHSPVILDALEIQWEGSGSPVSPDQ